MKDKKQKHRGRKEHRSAERKSDRMAAVHIVNRLEQVQEDLSDLLYEFRYLKRYSELEDVAMLTWRLDVLRAKVDRFAEHGSWEI